MTKQWGDPKEIHARLEAADKPGQHLWIMVACHLVADPTAEVQKASYANMISFTGPGCFKCEKNWSPFLARRPCRGSL